MRIDDPKATRTPAALPPVPAPIAVSSAPRPPVPWRPVMPAQPQGKAPVRSVFDAPPVAISAARKKAEDARRALSSSLQGLRNAAAQVEMAKEAIAADADAAAVFAHEGLTPESLKQFADLSAPLLKAFTAA